MARFGSGGNVPDVGGKHLHGRLPMRRRRQAGGHLLLHDVHDVSELLIGQLQRIENLFDLIVQFGMAMTLDGILLGRCDSVAGVDCRAQDAGGDEPVGSLVYERRDGIVGKCGHEVERHDL